MTASGPVNTVTSDWHWTGNLRLIEPDLMVLSPEAPDFSRRIHEPVMLLLLDRNAPSRSMLELAAKAGYVPENSGQTFEIRQIFGSNGEPRQIFAMRMKKIAPAPQ